MNSNKKGWIDEWGVEEKKVHSEEIVKNVGSRS